MLTACGQFSPDPAHKLSANLYDIYHCCVQWKTPDDGQRKCPKHVEFYSKKKFEKLVHLVGFIIRIYHNARSPERQIQLCAQQWYMSQFMLTACEQDQDGTDRARKLSAIQYDIYHCCVQWKTPDDGQRNCPKHVDFDFKNKFQKLVHLVGFIIKTWGKGYWILQSGKIAGIVVYKPKVTTSKVTVEIGT